MITYRDYQRECMDEFYAYHRRKRGNGLVVVPTAGGKSLIIGGLVAEISQNHPGTRIIVLSHVQELISQNAAKIRLCWKNASVGIYAAGLGLYQHHHPVIVASIQSVYKKAALFGRVDIIKIDEAHLLQPGSAGMYGTFIADLKKINPNLVVTGYTATDYRMDSGPLIEGDDALFTDVIIDIPIKRLLDEGYLTPPIGHSSLVQADLDGVKITAGEYNIKDMAARFDQKAFMNAALDSDMQYLKDRKSIALFCPTVENAEHVAEALVLRGIACEVVHGEMPRAQRDDIIERFKSGELRALASVGVITTGTDIPCIDCIVILRAMQSPGLYQQIVGRGFRVMYADGYDLSTRAGRIDAIRYGTKPNFLILDHGGNDRHGPVIAIAKPEKREKGKSKSIRPKARICEICRTINALENLTCTLCGSELVAPRDTTAALNVESSDVDILGTPFSRGEAPDWFNVDDVRYTQHMKDGKLMLKVNYYCGIMQFPEYFHVPSKRFSDWFVKRYSNLIYTVNIGAAMEVIENIKKPSRIQVLKRNNKYYEVLRHEFNAISEAQPAISA